MKSKLVLLLVFLFCSKFSHSVQLDWIEQTSGTTQTLTSVSNHAFGHAWICGYGGTVLKTTTMGANWINVSGNGIPANTQLISVASYGSNDVAVVAGYVGSNTFVYRSDNGGANWTLVFSQPNGFINSIAFPNPSVGTGFMMGDPVGGRWSLWKTTNGGANWDSAGLYLPQAGSEAGWVNSMYCRENSIWFGTNNSRVYHSTNSGSSWSIQATTGELNSYAVWFCGIGGPNDYTGFIGGTSLQKTTNSGLNWMSQTSTGSGNFGGISGGPNILIDNSAGYLLRFYVRSNSNIYKSENNSTNWSIDYTAPSGNYRYIASDYSGLKMWAVRDNGGISYLDMPVGVSGIGTSTPESYSLSQNYPNPFNPVTKIKFSIPPNINNQTSPVKLKVYNLAGNEVEVIVNENLSAGDYEYKFDAAGLSSGIYFYKMEAGNYSATKSMMLIK